VSVGSKGKKRKNGGKLRRGEKKGKKGLRQVPLEKGEGKKDLQGGRSNQSKSEKVDLSQKNSQRKKTEEKEVPCVILLSKEEERPSAYHGKGKRKWGCKKEMPLTDPHE